MQLLLPVSIYDIASIVSQNTDCSGDMSGQFSCSSQQQSAKALQMGGSQWFNQVACKAGLPEVLHGLAYLLDLSKTSELLSPPQ